MCDGGHSIRWIAIEPLKIVLIWTHNHQVRTNMELLAPFPRFRPSATVHVRNADAIDVRRAAGQAVLHPLQEYWVEAPWLVVGISGNTRQAGPFVRASTKDSVCASRRRRPIEQCRVFGDEGRTGAQRVRDFLLVSHRQSV